MSAGMLLGIEPAEIYFFELRKKSYRFVQLFNQTSKHVAFKMTSPNEKYFVRPEIGVLLPRSTCHIIVTMRAQREASDCAQCKDEFLVQSAIIEPGTMAKEIAAEMFSRESGNKVDEVKLRAIYASPPRSPSPLHVGTENRKVVLKAIKQIMEEATVYAEHLEEEYQEATIIISKLTEEKNSAIQQACKLQEKIETQTSRLMEEKNIAIQQTNRLREDIQQLLKREAGDRNGGYFSLKFVIIICLIGVLVSYLVKV